jgi:hypothetical protein
MEGSSSGEEEEWREFTLLIRDGDLVWDLPEEISDEKEHVPEATIQQVEDLVTLLKIHEINQIKKNIV